MPGPPKDQEVYRSELSRLLLLMIIVEIIFNKQNMTHVSITAASGEL